MGNPKDDLVAKTNALASRQRQNNGALATDFLSRQSIPAPGHLPIGTGARELGLLPPDQPDGSVLTLDSREAKRMKWAPPASPLSGTIDGTTIQLLATGRNGGSGIVSLAGWGADGFSYEALEDVAPVGVSGGVDLGPFRIMAQAEDAIAGRSHTLTAAVQLLVPGLYSVFASISADAEPAIGDSAFADLKMFGENGFCDLPGDFRLEFYRGGMYELSPEGGVIPFNYSSGSFIAPAFTYDIADPTDWDPTQHIVQFHLHFDFAANMNMSFQLAVTRLFSLFTQRRTFGSF